MCVSQRIQQNLIAVQYVSIKMTTMENLFYYCGFIDADCHILVVAFIFVYSYSKFVVFFSCNAYDTDVCSTIYWGSNRKRTKFILLKTSDLLQLDNSWHAHLTNHMRNHIEKPTKRQEWQNFELGYIASDSQYVCRS